MQCKELKFQQNSQRDTSIIHIIVVVPIISVMAYYYVTGFLEPSRGNKQDLENRKHFCGECALPPSKCVKLGYSQCRCERNKTIM
jgi:hypothetical protein